MSLLGRVRFALIHGFGAVAVLVGSASIALAQQAPAPAPAIEKVPLTAGRSTVLMTEFDITRVAVTDPAIADATVVQPREVLIDGKMPGTVSLIIWGAAERRQYDLVVEPGVSTLEQRLQALFPGEDIRVTATGDAVILAGRVSSNEVSLRAAEIATATASKAKVVNLLQLPGGAGSQQVLLKVRFAEVSRRALTEVGVSLFTSPTGINNTIGRVTTGQFAAPGFNNLQSTKASSSFGAEVVSSTGEFTFGDFLNIFLFNQKYDLGALIKALRGRGLFQSLAEPNLIAYNGQEASFLAGGEIPIPTVQGNAGSVGITYKEYGIRLNFTPTVAGDTIRLHVRPEVSTLDFPNGILISGFRIPALSTRRGETEVELRDGQTFAMAGLLNNLSQDDIQEIPGLARLPIIGHLFKTKSERAEQTELLVLITPQLVRPLNPDEVPPLPTLEQRFLPRPGDIGGQIQGGGGVVDAPDTTAPPR
ncbi:MAG TPA: pilus assembly protein N-terminal domain-containing protein [Vicinamibacterales bacterium]|nr:pilus assembly protein N-terminal domain-containing protein [Vicinamibacterales bacterium]